MHDMPQMEMLLVSCRLKKNIRYLRRYGPV